MLSRYFLVFPRRFRLYVSNQVFSLYYAIIPGRIHANAWLIPSFLTTCFRKIGPAREFPWPFFHFLSKFPAVISRNIV
jgi:hypothetical protein